MIHYLVELAIIHTLMAGGYWLLLTKESQYTMLRTYLISATLLSLIIPVLRLPAFWEFFQPETASSAFDFAVLLPYSDAVGSSAASSWTMSMLLATYLLVSGWLAFKIILGIGYLLRLKQSSRRETIAEIRLHLVPGLQGSFSFFRWIFINERLADRRAELLPILRHEHAHVRLGHTYDVLLLEIFRMLFWWLPGAWYLRSELKKIHEYQADAYTLKSHSYDEYSKILISASLQTNGLSLASSFHDGLILKRLHAMKQSMKQINKWKLSVLSVLAAVLFTVFACNEELEREISEVADQTYQSTDLSPLIQDAIAELETRNPGKEYAYLEILVNEANKDELRRRVEILEDKGLIAALESRGNEDNFGVIVEKGEQFEEVSRMLNKSSSSESGEGEIFTLVENPAEYPGGMDAFYQYIAENMIYPEQARKMGVSGKVYVQFIVNTDGSLSDVKPVKGIGAGCDAEAARVIAKAPKFNPASQKGRTVRQRLVIPVVFALRES